MLGNAFKVIVTLATSCLAGLICGALLGFLLGLGISPFSRAIVFSHQTGLMSIILSLVLGALLGAFALRMVNKFFESSDRLFVGAFAGAIVGLFFVLFVYGYINLPDPKNFERSVFYMSFRYSIFMGSRIGALIFPLFGAAGVLREIILSMRKKKADENVMNNELSFYNSQSSADDEE